MKRILACILSLVAALGVHAAAPDSGRIEAAVADPASEFYYPTLKEKYLSAEPRLSNEEYFHLYYGFAFEDDYRPLDPDPARDRAMEYIASTDFANPDPAQMRALIAAAEASLERDPFSPSMLNILAFAYGSIGENLQQAAYFERMSGILGAIESSGDGRSEKTAWHILQYSHATDLLSAYGLSFRKPEVTSRTTEYVALEKPKDKVKGYFFDFSRIYLKRPEDTTYKRPRTWQFNNLRPREYK